MVAKKPANASSSPSVNPLRLLSYFALLGTAAGDIFSRSRFHFVSFNSFNHALGIEQRVARNAA